VEELIKKLSTGKVVKILYETKDGVTTGSWEEMPVTPQMEAVNELPGIND
jgi:hypothetical protein